MLIGLNSKQRAPGPKSRDSFHSVLGQGHVLFSQGLTVTHNAKRGHMDISSSRLFQSPEVGVTLFLVLRAGMFLRKQYTMAMDH